MKMKLGKKNLIYSIFLAVTILIIIVSYLAFLLPNLYVNQNIESISEEIKKSHFEMVHGAKDLRKISKLGNQVFIEVDSDFNELKLNSIGLRGVINISGSEIQQSLKKIEDTMKSAKKNKGAGNFEAYEIDREASKIGKYIQDNFKIDGIKSDLKFSEAFKRRDENSYTDYKKLNKNTVMLSLSYREENVADYINCILITNEDGFYKVSLDSFIAPRIEDLLPVVLSSIPMIILVLMLLVIVVSSLYSRRIVEPIVKIQRFSEVSKRSTPNYNSINFHGEDEIATLSRNIVEMDKALRKNIEKLRVEGERKEVFTRSATHELKTPIAASILLCDGMINNLGKYEDRDKYLRVLKTELLEMSSMVSEILLTTKEMEELSFGDINLRDTFEKEISKYKLKTDEKNLKINLKGDGFLNTDSEIFIKVIDNILENAINYTSENGFIDIELGEDISIYNEEATIPREIEKSIMEPFVSSTESKSKGLGLYIAKYYSNLIGLEIEVRNKNKGVLTVLRRGRDD